jgi:hypothetical protein
MTTAHVDAVVKVLTVGASPEIKTKAWIAKQMQDAGLDWTTSVLFAVTDDVDWHDVVKVLGQGCSSRLCAEIFL